MTTGPFAAGGEVGGLRCPREPGGQPALADEAAGRRPLSAHPPGDD
jgi:hypothetical protein